MLDIEKIDYKSIIFTAMHFIISFTLTNKEWKEKQKCIDMCIGSPLYLGSLQSRIHLICYNNSWFPSQS